MASLLGTVVAAIVSAVLGIIGDRWNERRKARKLASIEGLEDANAALRHRVDSSGRDFDDLRVRSKSKARISIRPLPVREPPESD